MSPLRRISMRINRIRSPELAALAYCGVVMAPVIAGNALLLGVLLLCGR